MNSAHGSYACAARSSSNANVRRGGARRRSNPPRRALQAGARLSHGALPLNEGAGNPPRPSNSARGSIRMSLLRGQYTSPQPETFANPQGNSLTRGPSRHDTLQNPLSETESAFQ